MRCEKTTVFRRPDISELRYGCASLWRSRGGVRKLSVLTLSPYTAPCDISTKMRYPCSARASF
jgi:hypothetical protein